MAHTGWFPGDTREGRSGISHFSLLEGQGLPPIVHAESPLQSQPRCPRWRREENEFCIPYGALGPEGQVPFIFRARKDDFLRAHGSRGLWLQRACVCSAVAAGNLGYRLRCQVNDSATRTTSFFKKESKLEVGGNVRTALCSALFRFIFLNIIRRKTEQVSVSVGTYE